MTDALREILVVNPNSNPATTEMLLRIGKAAAAQHGLHLRGVTVERGPRMIVDAPALARSAATTVATARAAIGPRTRGVIIGAFGDPGASSLRESVRVPVVGIGASAIDIASRAGRFAIVTTTPGLIDPLDGLVAATATGSDYAGTFLTEGDPVELAGEPDRMLAALEATVDAAVAAGAQSVVIGGGPLSDSARALAARTDVQIVEPMPAAVAAMITLLASEASMSTVSGSSAQ